MKNLYHFWGKNLPNFSVQVADTASFHDFSGNLVAVFSVSATGGNALFAGISKGQWQKWQFFSKSLRARVRERTATSMIHGFLL